MTTEKEPLRLGAILKAAVTGVTAVGAALFLCVLIAVVGGDGLDTGEIVNRGLLCLAPVPWLLSSGHSSRREWQRTTSSTWAWSPRPAKH